MSRSTLDTAMSLSFSLTGLSPSLAGLSRTVLLTIRNHFCSPNPDMHARRFGLFPFRSPLLWKSTFLSLPPATQMFQFTGFPPHHYSCLRTVHGTVTVLCTAGFPHSDIHGSQVICTSPWLFAAYHVFLRLLVPRHPPCALFSLTC